MEVILEASMDLETIVDDVAGAVTRNPGGYHVTDLYQAAEQILGRKKPNFSDMPGLAAMGRLWEHTIISSFKKHEIETVLLPSITMELDGIEGNLDGYLLHKEDGSTAVVECKSKWGNKMLPPWDEPRYMVQVKAYCKMANTPKVIFYMLYLKMGPPACIPKVYHLEFNQQEIDENWAMLTNTKKYLMEHPAIVNNKEENK